MPAYTHRMPALIFINFHPFALTAIMRYLCMQHIEALL